MPNKTAIVTDTNCGLRPEEAAELGIRVIPMPVILDGECFFEYDSISQAEFFEALKGGAEVSTSQPAPGVIQQCWDAILEDHEELIYIPMSAGLSGECQTALGLAQDYGGRVRVADNRRISVTERQAALDALSLARQGRTAAEIQAFLEADGGNSDIFVAVNTLELLKKSGRVTAAGAALGSMLSIKPVLHVDSEGRLIARSKVRGRVQALRAIAMKFGELEADKDQMIFISHGDCEKDAMVVKETLVKEFGCDPERIILSAVGPVIGSHSGPGTVALFFRGKDRG